MGFIDIHSFDLGNPEWIGVALVTVGGIATLGYQVLPWIWKRTVYRNLNFELEVVDHFPPESDKLQGLLSFPLGINELHVVVQSQYRFSIARFNLRFLSKGFGNIPTEVVEVISVKYWNDSFIEIDCFADSEGGMGADFSRKLKRNDGLYFVVEVQARKPCVGVLSFRAVDENMLESFAHNKLMAFGLNYDNAVQLWWEGTSYYRG